MKPNSLKHLLLTTYANFKRNKVRTFLTSLGITIGVMSVVLLNALGLGLKNFLKEQFENLGSNMVMVMPGNAFNDEEGVGNAFGPGLIGGVSFDEKDYQNLDKIPEADYVVPVFFKSVTLEYNGIKQLGYIEGANQDIFPTVNLVPIAGRIYTKSDLQKKSKVTVLGFVVAEKLFDSPEQALGKTIKINTHRFKVIGVIEKKGDGEMDNAAIVPYTSTFGNLNPDKT
ncbi:MAG: ABC transporter permease, partial [Candidatus Beckwithbacteria bacterium]